MSLADLPIPLSEQQHIVLDHVSWDFYEQVLREVGDRPTRVTFYRGSIEIMSPLPEHEWWKKRIDLLVEKLASELDIDVEPLGSTTFRKKAEESGLEPDECYYIRHAAEVQKVDQLDPLTIPVPDLAVEIDITSRSIKREPIYAALRVPELWRFDGKRLHVLELMSDARYSERETSLSFPFLPMERFCEFLLRMRGEKKSVVLREFGAWAQTLKR